MPWNQAQKKVLRVNPDFTGATVWQQDQTSNIKIIAQRHDFHDEDLAAAISRCLNLDGFNAMASDLDVGTHKLLNVVPGVAGLDGVNWNQLADVDAKAQDALDQLAVLPDNNQILSQTWNGVQLSLNRATGGPLLCPVPYFNTFKSNGAIRHKLNDQGTGAATIDVSIANRHYISNNAPLTLTFAGLPSATDTDLGDTYQVEGQVMIWNTTGAGAITIAGITGQRVIGAPTTSATAAQILSYMFQRVAGVNQYTLVWSF
jgi:hypothetical protein